MATCVAFCESGSQAEQQVGHHRVIGTMPPPRLAPAGGAQQHLPGCDARLSRQLHVC